MEFLLADEEVNYYGFRLLMSGARLDRFLINPVMFLNHDTDDLPIGKWDAVKVKAKTLVGVPVFDSDDEESARIAGKVERGFLKGASVSIMPIAVSDDPDLMLPGQILPTVTEWELLETSIVGLPGSKNALKLNIDGELLTLNSESFDKVQLAFRRLLQTSPSQTPMKRVFLKLNLAENASEDEAVRSIADLQAKVTALTTKLEEAEQLSLNLDRESKEALVDEAIAAGRLPATSRDLTIQAMLALKLEDSRKLLLSLTPASSALGIIKTDKGPEPRAGWTIRDWEVKDAKGLMKLKLEKPTEYARMFEAFYHEKYVE